MQSRLMDILEAPPTSSPEEMAATAEAVVILAGCLALLPLRQRVLLDLRYRRSLKLREIAVEFGVGEPAIHAMHARAIANLRRALADRRIQCLSDLL